MSVNFKVDPLNSSSEGFPTEEDAFCDIDSLVRISKAVCRVITPDGLGTGCVVAPNLLFTCNHLLDSKETASQSFAEFYYDTDKETPNAHPKIRVKLDPDRLFISSPAPEEEESFSSFALDYTFVAIESDEALTSIFRHAVPLFGAENIIPHLAYIIQHPEGYGKKISLGDNKVTYVDDCTIHYTTKCLSGSSGAPVFVPDGNTLKLVALHHGWTSEKGYNIGVRISPILSDLQLQDSLRVIRYWPHLKNEDPIECYRYGLTLYKTEKYAEALDLFHAAEGFPPAQNVIGTCYENGFGVSQNYERAAEWYQKAAYHNGVAAYNLALCYHKGRGVPQDTSRAIHWLYEAEKKDIPEAKSFLAQLDNFEKGKFYLSLMRRKTRPFMAGM